MYLKLQVNDVCVFGVKEKQKKEEKKKGLGAGAIIGIILLLVFVLGITAWCVYAYRHPTSKSGLFFIEVEIFSVALVIDCHCVPSTKTSR